MFTNISFMLAEGESRCAALFMKNSASLASLYTQAELESDKWFGEWTCFSSTYWTYDSGRNNAIYFENINAAIIVGHDLPVASYFHVDCDLSEVATKIRLLLSKNNLWFTFSMKDGFKVIGPVK